LISDLIDDASHPMLRLWHRDSTNIKNMNMNRWFTDESHCFDL